MLLGLLTALIIYPTVGVLLYVFSRMVQVYSGVSRAEGGFDEAGKSYESFIVSTRQIMRRNLDEEDMRVLEELAELDPIAETNAMDCIFYNGAYVRCAVHPTKTSCVGCLDYISKGE